MDGGNGYGNRNTIGIEICRNYDRKRGTTNLITPLAGMYTKAEQNAIKVGAQIHLELGIPATVDTVKKHQDWSGKWCPSKILNEGRWILFQSAVIGEYIRLVQGGSPQISNPIVSGAQVSKPAKPAANKYFNTIVKSYPEEMWFQANTTILARSAPHVQSKNIAKYKPGEYLKYVAVHMGNGYVWVEYKRLSGGKGYLPVREYTPTGVKELWGTITRTEPKAKVINPFDTIIKSYPERMKMIANTYINVRSAPTGNATILAQYAPGESVTYDRVLLGNGFVWLEYERGSGGKGYLPFQPYPILSGQATYGRLVPA